MDTVARAPTAIDKMVRASPKAKKIRQDDAVGSMGVIACVI
jgi:hypothetical protein